MKSQFSNTIADKIQYDVVSGPVSKPFIRTEYWTGSTWAQFEDVVSRDIKISSVNKKYSSFSFLPPSSEFGMVLDNSGQIYATGSGDPKASILKKNLKVRCWTGFELPGGSENSYGDDFTGNNKFFHTYLTGGKIVLDIAPYYGTISKYALINTYDRFKLDSRTLSSEGYYTKRFFFGTVYDAGKSIRVEASSGKMDLAYKYRAAGWSPFFPLEAGANIIPAESNPGAGHVDVMIRWNTGSWATADNISSLKLFAKRKGYEFVRGIYIIDEPEYDNTVKVKGRDYLKKSLETEINLPEITDVNIADVIALICDRCSIPYDLSKWDTTTTEISIDSTLADDLNNIKGWDALDYAMDALNAGTDEWRLAWDEAGGMVLKKIPTAPGADYFINWQNNIEDVSKSFGSDKQLQRVTVLNKDIVVNPEQLLKSVSGTAAHSALNATFAKSLYVRYEDSASAIVSESARSNTGVSFLVNSGAAYDIKIYGCRPKNAITNEVFSERGHSGNIIKNDGQTYKLINPLLNQAQCLALTEKLISRYSDPPMEIDLTMVPNPYLELHDRIIVNDLYTATNNVYRIQEISESFRPSMLKDKLNLRDTGFDIGPITWDANGLDEGLSDFGYDSGLFFDGGVANSDTNIYPRIKNA